MENIDKMINCGDPSFGGAMYSCPHCGNFKFVPFRCHSRFCPTCGNKYAMERTTSISFKLVSVQHRHCVFTIDENLRDFFLKDLSPELPLSFCLQCDIKNVFQSEPCQKTILPAISWSSILSAGISNGIPTSTVSFLKAVTVMTASVAM